MQRCEPDQDQTLSVKRPRRGHAACVLKSSLALLVLATAYSPARAQGVAGTYLLDYPARIQVTNGEESVELGKARLTLQVKGDSLIGTWLTLDRPDAKPREIRGTVQGHTAKWTIENEGRISDGGEVRTVKMITNFSATVTGDKVEGTMQSRSPDAGGMTAPERKFSGVRQKSD